MKRLFTIAVVAVLCFSAYGQRKLRPFHAYLYNKEYEIFLNINFYEQDVTVPDQELYGELPGYLGKERNSFCWVIPSVKLRDERTAEVSFINDYGSEDFKALLTADNDSVYTLKHMGGSALKVPKNGKWQKLPPVIELKRK